MNVSFISMFLWILCFTYADGSYLLHFMLQILFLITKFELLIHMTKLLHITWNVCSPCIYCWRSAVGCFSICTFHCHIFVIVSSACNYSCFCLNISLCILNVIIWLLEIIELWPLSNWLPVFIKVLIVFGPSFTCRVGIPVYRYI